MDNTNRTPATGPALVEDGAFIRIPAWKREGLVVASRPASMGSDAAIEVLIEVKPDDPSPKWFRLEPTEYEVL